MGRRAQATRTIAELARILARQGEKLLKTSGRQTVRGGHHKCLIGDEGRRSKVFLRIVWQFAIQRGRERHMAIAAYQHGVAISRTLPGNQRDGRQAARPAAIIDHQGLSPSLGQRLPDQTCNDIGSAAGCTGYHHTNRPAGKI